MQSAHCASLQSVHCPAGTQSWTAPRPILLCSARRAPALQATQDVAGTLTQSIEVHTHGSATRFAATAPCSPRRRRNARSSGANPLRIRGRNQLHRMVQRNNADVVFGLWYACTLLPGQRHHSGPETRPSSFHHTPTSPTGAIISAPVWAPQSGPRLHSRRTPAATAAAAAGRQQHPSRQAPARAAPPCPGHPARQHQQSHQRTTHTSVSSDQAGKLP